MSLKSKAKAAKRREQLKTARELDQQRTSQKAEQLKAATSGFARTPRGKAIVEHYEAAKMPQYVKKKPVHHAGDDAERFTGKPIVNAPILSEDMQKREQAAQQRTREIQKRVDVGYNKGGLMLLSESEFAAMQKGELRRRS